MRLRHFIFGLAIASYAVSLAHSILPHTHYTSFADHDHHHNKNESGNNHGDQHDHQGHRGLAFPVHFSNADVSISKFVFELNTESQKIVHATPVIDDYHLDERFGSKVFHVPIGLLEPRLLKISSPGLRAPPLHT